MLASEQRDVRSRNQLYSAKSKSRDGPVAKECDVTPGCLVYLKEDGDKTKARERYIVVSVGNDGCVIQKITKALRNTQYKVKSSELFAVTPTINDMNVILEDEEEEDARDVIPDDDEQASVADVPTQDVHSPRHVEPPRPSQADAQSLMADMPGLSNGDTIDAELQMAASAPDERLRGIPEETLDHQRVPESAVVDAAAVNENHLGSTESPLDDEPSERRRSRRQPRRPARFHDYHLY